MMTDLLYLLSPLVIVGLLAGVHHGLEAIALSSSRRRYVRAVAPKEGR